MTLQRMQHAGAAPSTQLNGGISAAAASITVQSGTGYPDGSVGPFVIKIDAGTTSEEKILCSARSGTTITVSSGGRGYDNTVATSHSNGAAVEHDFAAVEADDMNDHIYTTTRFDHDTQYARRDGSNAFTGLVTAPDYKATGIGGSTAGSRYVGATTGGLPASGTYLTGDFAVDQTGAMLVCTSGGSPGTWVRVGGGHYAARYYCTNTAAYSSAGVNWTVFKYDTMDYDPLTMYSASTGLFTLPLAGIWHFDAQLRLQTDGTHAFSGTAELSLVQGTAVTVGNELILGVESHSILVSSDQAVSVHADLKVAANATVGVGSFVTATTGLTGVTGSNNTWVALRYVGPSA